MSDKIITYSKQYINPLDPDKENIFLTDIAHALSKICRANGQLPVFFSVAEHSIFCCREAMERGYSNKLCLALLMHDASEAYIADIVRPVKRSLDDYLRIEKRMQDAIYEKFVGEITDEDRIIISEIDDAMLYWEFFNFMDVEIMEKRELLSKPTYQNRSFSDVETEFISLYYQLKNNEE